MSKPNSDSEEILSSQSDESEDPLESLLNLWKSQKREKTAADILFEFIENENWLEAKNFLENNVIEIPVTSEGYENSILDVLADRAIAIKDDQEFLEFESLMNDLIERGEKLSYNRSHYGTNTLHIIAHYRYDEQYKIRLLDMLLKAASSAELNCYDVFGKTPLLEAIEKGNKEVALRLLQEPDLDPNLYKIEHEHLRSLNLGLHKQKIKSGTSTYQAALEYMPEIAEAIVAHPRYNPNTKYVKLTTDVLYRQFDHYAVQGNVDTLKAILRQVDIKYFLSPDEGSRWTVLHLACFSGNLSVVEFLLNKEELEKASGQKISDEDFKKFVNHQDSTQTTALGRAMFGRKFEAQARLFINCKQFNVNRILTFPSEFLAHNLAERDAKELMLELAKRKDFQLDLKDASQNTPLRIACLSGNVDMVKLLIGLGEMVNIDVKELSKGEAPIMSRLRDYIEENWFGQNIVYPILLLNGEELSSDDLYRLHDLENSLPVRVRYEKELFDVKVEFPSDFPEAEKEKIRKHLQEECLLMANHAGGNIELSTTHLPEWYDEELGRKISQYLDSKKMHYFEEGEKAEIEIDGIKMKFTIKNKREEEVEEEMSIEPGNLQIEDNTEKSLQNKRVGYDPLLDSIAKKYQEALAAKDQTQAEKLLKIFKIIALHPQSQVLLSKTTALDRLISGNPELQKILEEARKQNSQLPNTQVPENDIDPFSSTLINRIFLANLSREFIKRKDEVKERRFDSLSRIIFGDAKCSAACFDGEKILVSTNLTTPRTKELIAKTMDYFANFANGISTEEEKFNLICESSANLILDESGKLSKRLSEDEIKKNKKLNEDYIRKFKQEEELRRDLKNLTKCVYDNFDTIKRMNFDENGVLDDVSFEAIKEMPAFHQVIKSLDGKDFREGYIRNAIKYSFRGFKDAVKIENSIRGGTANKDFDRKIFQAFQAKNYLYLNETYPQKEGVHAEMRIADYLLPKIKDREKYYIGLPKLCCAHCNFVLSNIENFSINSEPFTRGRHTEIFEWPVPNFLKERFLKIFKDDKELCATFKATKDPIKLIQECFKRESIQVRLLLGLLGRTNQDLDLSTSVPTLAQKSSANKKIFRETKYFLSDEVIGILRATLHNAQFEKATKEILEKETKQILLSSDLKKDGLEKLIDGLEVPKKLIKEFLSRKYKLDQMQKLNLDSYQDLDALKAELEKIDLGKDKKKSCAAIDDLDILKKFFADETDAKQKEFDQDVKTIIDAKTKNKTDGSEYRTKLLNVIYYSEADEVMSEEKFNRYLTDLKFSAEHEALWRKSYATICAAKASAQDLGQTTSEAKDDDERKSDDKDSLGAELSDLEENINALDELDEFNYVTNGSNLTHQNVNYLLSLAFQKNGLTEVEYNELNRVGSVDTVVIGAEELDYSLRDAILKFIGQEDPQEEQASFALCRGHLVDQRLRGDTHWTALHLRKITNVDGTISLKAYHMNSSGDAIPETVNRVLIAIKNMQLTDLDAECQLSHTNQRAIPRLSNINFKDCQPLPCLKQADGNSCGDHAVFNILRMHDSIDLTALDSEVMQDGISISCRDFITQRRADLQQRFNGDVDIRRTQYSKKISDISVDSGLKLDEEILHNSEFAQAVVESITFNDKFSATEKLRKLIAVEDFIKNSKQDETILSLLNIEKYYQKTVVDFVEQARFIRCDILSAEENSMLQNLTNPQNFQEPSVFLHRLETIARDYDLSSADHSVGAASATPSSSVHHPHSPTAKEKLITSNLHL